MLLTHCHVHSELACVTETIMLTVECMCYRDSIMLTVECMCYRDYHAHSGVHVIPNVFLPSFQVLCGVCRLPERICPQ